MVATVIHRIQSAQMCPFFAKDSQRAVSARSTLGLAIQCKYRIDIVLLGQDGYGWLYAHYLESFINLYGRVNGS